MRCLHHVFLRGGIALLLLAGAGLGAWSLPAATCHAARTGTHAPALHAHC
ncbi:MAG: hypothetical protein HOQ02_06410 [Lysobacter sp.]|nr:hypothetical protein [Lysobacter sp.]